MDAEQRHQRMDAARVHAQLAVQDLWLRYISLGGTGDAFDLDGYLQGLVPLDPFQQDVLAQTLNEALADLHHSYLIPLSPSAAVNGSDDERLHRLLDRLLADPRQHPDHGSHGDQDP